MTYFYRKTLVNFGVFRATSHPHTKSSLLCAQSFHSPPEQFCDQVILVFVDYIVSMILALLAKGLSCLFNNDYQSIASIQNQELSRGCGARFLCVTFVSILGHLGTQMTNICAGSSYERDDIVPQPALLRLESFKLNGFEIVDIIIMAVL